MTRTSVDDLLAPFAVAKTDKDLRDAEGRLRRDVKRGKVDEADVTAALKKAPENLAPFVEKSLHGTRKPAIDKMKVAEYRAELSTLIGDRHGEKKFIQLQTRLLIDILEAVSG